MLCNSRSYKSNECYKIIIYLNNIIRGFIILIGGLFLELILSIKRNKELENKLNVFYKLVDENKYSCIVIYDENGKIKFANKAVKNFMFKNPCEKDKRVESVITKRMKEVDKDLIFEINNYLI